jgi:hypothetical protein
MTSRLRDLELLAPGRACSRRSLSKSLSWDTRVIAAAVTVLRWVLVVGLSCYLLGLVTGITRIDPARPNNEGYVRSSGELLGDWALHVDVCMSAEPMGVAGVYLFSSLDRLRSLELKRVSSKEIITTIYNEEGGRVVSFSRSDCPQFDIDFGSDSRRPDELSGYAKLACFRTGSSIEASIKFTHCR